MSKKKFFIFALFILLFTIGISVRLYFWLFHFTHCDDIGIAVHFLNCDSIRERALSVFDWTYGPLQYFVETPLILLGKSYSSIIALGRFPSFLIGVLNLFLCHFILYSFFKKWWIILLGDLYVVLSWENIIYGSQMEPYIIAITFIFLQLYILKEWLNNDKPLKWKLTLTLIIGVFSCYAQYQLFLFVFSFYIALFAINCSNRVVLKKIFLIAAANFLLCIPLLLALFKFEILGSSLNWNVGLHNEFLLDFSDKHGFLDIIFYGFVFFIKNTFYITKYFFTSGDSLISDLYSILIILSGIWGLVKINDFKERYKYIGLYLDIIMVLYIILIFNGNLAFGPSRHNLVLFPIIVFLSAYGINKINIKYGLFIQFIIFVLYVTIVASFIFVLPKETSKRKNLFSESAIEDIIEKYKPNAILGYENLQYDIALIRCDGYRHKSKWLRYSLLERNNKVNTSNIIVLLSNKKIREKDLKKISKYVDEDNLNFNFLKNQSELIFSEENEKNCQVDYASYFFENQSNGYCLYVYKVNEKN